MKKEIIQQLYSAFELAALEVDGVECWSARELQTLLGYSLWQNFTKVIDKAKVACENVNQSISDHFIGVNKKVELGSGAQREIENLMLTRYACYQVAKNGDQALFRLNTATLKRKMGVPASRPLADFLPTISIKAKDFAAEMTSMNVQTKDLQSETMIAKEHIDNNAAVRKMQSIIRYFIDSNKNRYHSVVNFIKYVEDVLYLPK